MQQREPIISPPRFSSFAQKELDSGNSSLLYCHKKRTFADIITRVHVGSCFNKKLGEVGQVLTRRNKQRRLATPVAHVHVSTPGKQEAERVDILKANSPMD